MNDLTIQRTISERVEEYEAKRIALGAQLSAYEQSCDDLKTAATVGGTFGNVTIDTQRIWESTLQESLLKSAWFNVKQTINRGAVMSAKDQKQFEQAMTDPPEFTKDNIRATFGDYILDPWGNILRGLAEVFCDLDQSYKSHEKVKIGVEGLPKRIILSGFGGYSSWGWEKLADVINALAAYQGKPLITGYWSLKNLLEEDEEYFLKDEYDDEGNLQCTARGFKVRLYKNGNGHVIFAPDTLKDINRALAEYYGEVLPDSHEAKPEKRAESTAVSKDLQYYPTPPETVNRVMREIYIEEGDLILEPSCGCGRLMDGIRAECPKAIIHGIEFDGARAQEARGKGHKVLTANFLETEPTPKYDRVIMNPPFYGKHYAKHVNHALKFLKPGGILTAILPITARYDHGLLEGRWRDLPVGSFRESGTNINTTVLTIRKTLANEKGKAL